MSEGKSVLVTVMKWRISGQRQAIDQVFKIRTV